MLIYLTMIEAEEDRHRFLSLYRRYKKLMLYIAHDILPRPHDAEDAVHEAFLRLAEMIEEIRKRLNFTTLRYHRLDDLVESVGISPCKLCTYCWNGKH